jgi:2-keto-3-deoxy-L-rhamnonate aldolase RhmA
VSRSVMGTLLETMAVRPLVGTFLKLPRAEVVEVLGLAGFDFVICDMEHGQVTESDARSVVRACAANGIHGIVRVPEPSAGVVNRLLEAGAAGISMPRLRSAAEARDLRAMMRFPPGARARSARTTRWPHTGRSRSPTTCAAPTSGQP